MDINPEHARSLFYTSIAGIGGALGYIYRETRAGRAIRFARVLLSAALAAFIGFHMIMVYQSMGLSEEMIGALNGLTAILGVEFALFVLEKTIFKHLGINYDKRATEALIAAGWLPPGSTSGASNYVGMEQNPNPAKRETGTG